MKKIKITMWKVQVPGNLLWSFPCRSTYSVKLSSGDSLLWYSHKPLYLSMRDKICTTSPLIYALHLCKAVIIGVAPTRPRKCLWYHYYEPTWKTDLMTETLYECCCNAGASMIMLERGRVEGSWGTKRKDNATWI